MADYNLRQIDQVMESLFVMKTSAGYYTSEGFEEWVHIMKKCADNVVGVVPPSTFLGLGFFLSRQTFNPQKINIGLTLVNSRKNKEENDALPPVLESFKLTRAEMLAALVMSELFSTAIVKKCEFIADPLDSKNTLTHEGFIRHLLDLVTKHIEFAQSKSLALALIYILEDILEAIEDDEQKINKLAFSLAGYILLKLNGHKLAEEEEHQVVVKKAKREIVDKNILLRVENEDVLVTLTEDEFVKVESVVTSLQSSQDDLDSKLVACFQTTCNQLASLDSAETMEMAKSTKLLVLLVGMANSIPSRSDSLNTCLEQCEPIAKANAPSIGQGRSLLFMARSISMKNLKKVQNSLQSIKVDEKISNLVKGKMASIQKKFAGLAKSGTTAANDPYHMAGEEQLESCSGDDLDY